MDESYVYKYEHTNGEIITKPQVVVESMPGGAFEYFDSPFVRRWWKEDKDGNVVKDQF